MIDEDISKVTRMWNEFFVQDQTTSNELLRRFYKNEYVNPVPPVSNDLAFSLAATRGKHFFHEKDEDGKGWILAAGFRRDSDYLHQLMNAQFEEFTNRKIGRIYYSNMVPNYFLPGIDEDRYPKLKSLLWDLGFKQVQRVISMEASLVSIIPQLREINGVSVSKVKENEKTGLLSFIKNNFSADWYYRAEEVLEKGASEQIIVARRNNRIIGYGMFSAGEGEEWYRLGERFGPFGVLESERSNGIGSAILSNLIRNMKEMKITRAYFLWTDERASHLYKRAGFEISRTFIILEKVISRYF